MNDPRPGRLVRCHAPSLLLGAALLCLPVCSAAPRADQQPPTPPNQLTAAERAAGFELLFDGESLDGWRGFRTDHAPDGWLVDDGCISLDGLGGDLITDHGYGNFELRLQWKISEGGNSGIFFRVSEEHDYVWLTGPEMQVLDNIRHADGQSPFTSAGSNYALHAPSQDVTRPVGEFNDVRLRVDGDRVEHWLNDRKLVEYRLGSPSWESLVAASKFASMPAYGRLPEGHIALQDHGNRVWYRSMRILRLD
jgi:hypothetical protein